MSTLAKILKTINNANRKGDRQVLIRQSCNTSIAFLTFMLSNGYISSFTKIHDHQKGKIVVDLNGRLVKCGAICPRFNVKTKEIESWRDRLLPARQFGHLVMSTNQGVMDQEECLKQRIGGVLLGFFY